MPLPTQSHVCLWQDGWAGCREGLELLRRHHCSLVLLRSGQRFPAFISVFFSAGEPKPKAEVRESRGSAASLLLSELEGWGAAGEMGNGDASNASRLSFMGPSSHPQWSRCSKPPRQVSGGRLYPEPRWHRGFALTSTLAHPVSCKPGDKPSIWSPLLSPGLKTLSRCRIYDVVSHS